MIGNIHTFRNTAPTDRPTESFFNTESAKRQEPCGAASDYDGRYSASTALKDKTARLIKYRSVYVDHGQINAVCRSK